MTWTAPEITRAEEPFLGDERTMLDAVLQYHRETLLLKCAGLTSEQLKLRVVEPSSLTLLGLVRHLAEVELTWFRLRFAGLDVCYHYYREGSPDDDFDDLDTADAAADLATFADEVRLARETVAHRSLDDTFVHLDAERSLRFVYLRLIAEYARHNGHADLIRQRIDGRTGV